MDLAINIAVWALAAILVISTIIIVVTAASMLYDFIKDLFNGRF